jgi:hypothetical protein
MLGGLAATFPAWADTYIDLDLPGGPDRRELTTAFPQKAQMILQRTRPTRGQNGSDGVMSGLADKIGSKFDLRSSK